MREFKPCAVVGVMILILSLLSGCVTVERKADTAWKEEGQAAELKEDEVDAVAQAVEVLPEEEAIELEIKEPESVSEPVQEPMKAAKPEIKILNVITGNNDTEVLENIDVVIKVNISNSGDLDATGLSVVLSSDDYYKDAPVLVQQLSVHRIPALEEKLVQFEIVSPDVDETREIHLTVKVKGPEFGELASMGYTLKVIDGEYKTYISIKGAADNKERKKLSLEYLTAIDNGEYKGRYKKEMENILDGILWCQVKSSCNKESCKEYLNIFPEDSGGHWSAVNEKLEEVDELIAVKKKDTYRGYQNFIKKYKNGVCTDSIKNRTEMDYWTNKEKDSHILTQIGEIHRDTMEYDRAINTFKMAIELDKDNVGAYEGLGRLYYLDKKDAGTAKSYLLSAEELKSEDHQTYYILGRIYGKTGCTSNQHKTALKYYSMATEKNPTCVECYYLRARLCMSLLHKRSQAIKDFIKVTELEKSGFYYISSKGFLEKFGILHNRMKVLKNRD